MLSHVFNAEWRDLIGGEASPLVYRCFKIDDSISMLTIGTAGVFVRIFYSGDLVSLAASFAARRCVLLKLERRVVVAAAHGSSGLRKIVPIVQWWQRMVQRGRSRR